MPPDAPSPIAFCGGSVPISRATLTRRQSRRYFGSRHTAVHHRPNTVCRARRECVCAGTTRGPLIKARTTGSPQTAASLMRPRPWLYCREVPSDCSDTLRARRHPRVFRVCHPIPMARNSARAAARAPAVKVRADPPVALAQASDTAGPYAATTPRSATPTPKPVTAHRSVVSGGARPRTLLISCTVSSRAGDRAPPSYAFPAHALGTLTAHYLCTPATSSASRSARGLALSHVQPGATYLN
jgi:hypothetical protein